MAGVREAMLAGLAMNRAADAAVTTTAIANAEGPVVALGASISLRAREKDQEQDKEYADRRGPQSAGERGQGGRLETQQAPRTLPGARSQPGPGQDEAPRVLRRSERIRAIAARKATGNGGSKNEGSVHRIRLVGACKVMKLPYRGKKTARTKAIKK